MALWVKVINIDYKSTNPKNTELPTNDTSGTRIGYFVYTMAPNKKSNYHYSSSSATDLPTFSGTVSKSLILVHSNDKQKIQSPRYVGQNL